MARGRRDQDTRRKILEVAEAQFGAKGYPGTHLQSIAEEVGVQKTALYYYFSSKEALYVAVLERMLETFERVFRETTSRGEPSAEMLEGLLDGLNDVLAAHPNFSGILIRIFVDRIKIDTTAIESIVERMISPMVRFYAAGVEKGVFRRLSSRHVFITALGASIFHYAAGNSSSGILGIEDVFAQDSVEWRRKELRRLLTRGMLLGSDES